MQFCLIHWFNAQFYCAVIVVVIYVFLFQLYTISQDGALCVWQCDTELNGLKPRMPKQQTEDKEELTIDQEAEFSEEQQGKTVQGKVNENEQESRKKVKYSCAAK